MSAASFRACATSAPPAHHPSVTPNGPQRSNAGQQPAPEDLARLAETMFAALADAYGRLARALAPALADAVEVLAAARRQHPELFDACAPPRARAPRNGPPLPRLDGRRRHR